MLRGISEKELKDLGLDPRDISTHQQRISGSQQSSSLTIPILDTCRLENAGILPQDFLQKKGDRPLDGIVAFVPAAGAASRYFKPLQDLRQALADDHSEAVRAEIETLKKQGAADWPLPPQLESLLAGKAVGPEALAEIDAAKALLPYKKSGESFLQKKDREHRAIKGIAGQVYVAPLGQAEAFKKHLNAAPGLPTLFLEQGPEMSTLRFLPNGDAYRENDKLSVVPAGHGTLVKLFPEIKKNFPGSHSLFIRNIDNVLQDEEEAEAQKSIALFLEQHQFVLESLRRIRSQLRDGPQTRVAETARDLLENFKNPASFRPGPLQINEPWKAVWAVLLQVFHCPAHYARLQQERYGDREALCRLFDRPLNSLGQVPNSGKDVGGTPVFARPDNGDVTICLELPHVSDRDRKHFLEDPARATHFNPVFVAAELPEDGRAYQLDDCPFWILAEKSLHGTSVVYHEIVLYEILGNSFTANVLFPEIPRCLFHPHKALTDGVKKL